MNSEHLITDAELSRMQEEIENLQRWSVDVAQRLKYIEEKIQLDTQGMTGKSTMRDLLYTFDLMLLLGHWEAGRRLKLWPDE